MPAIFPLSTIRYSLQIGRFSNQHSRISRVPAALTRLSGERTAGDVRCHAVMRHCPPRIVFRRRLRKPDVTGIAGELAALQCADHRVAVANLAARGVHRIRTSISSFCGAWNELRTHRSLNKDPPLRRSSRAACSASVSHLSAISMKSDLCCEVRAASANRMHSAALLRNWSKLGKSAFIS